MADAMRRVWQPLQRIAAARVDLARIDHGRMLRIAADAAEDVAQADAALAAAEAAWRQQLADGFDPILGRAYACDVTERVGAAAAAAEQLQRAEAETARSKAEWQREAARGEALSRQAAAAARHARRQLEERALLAISDRVALRWSRR